MPLESTGQCSELMNGLLLRGETVRFLVIPGLDAGNPGIGA